MPEKNMNEIAKRVFQIEAEAIKSLSDKLDENFEKAIDLLMNTKRVVLTGVGKAGHIACKIAATLASTGTPAFFMHPSEGLHGDLGMITSQNVMIALSKNGHSDEVLRLIPYLKHFKIPLIAITGNPDSALGKQSDVILNIAVKEEACPLGLAPTASTTAMLAMGDALAVALLEKRNFRIEDFAILHPAGTLGRRLLIKVRDEMHVGEENPVIHEKSTMKEAIIEMTGKGLGATSIINDEGKLTGIITDGDLRRILYTGTCDFDKKVIEYMVKNPKCVHPDTLAVKAIDIMEQYNITVLPVIDEENHPVGMIHLHHLIKAGITT
jgi:arabinose-5-phosphate isomerase